MCGFPGTADSFERRLWVAHLAAGELSVVSHEAAAALHGLPGFGRDTPVITVPHPCHLRLEGVTLHQITDLLVCTPGHVVRHLLAGLPVTDPARTMVDLAAVVHPARLRMAVDEAVHRRLTTYAAIGDCVRVVARVGKPGVHRLLALLDSRERRQAPTTSEAERIFLDLIRGTLPDPEVQKRLPGAGIEGICDCRWCDVKLIVEIDSRSWHSRIQDIKRDRERDAQAARAGWQTVRILYEHVRDDPAGTLAELVEIRAVRLDQLGAA